MVGPQDTVVGSRAVVEPTAAQLVKLKPPAFVSVFGVFSGDGSLDRKTATTTTTKLKLTKTKQNSNKNPVLDYFSLRG